ncbi:MAG TPA: TIGR02530 family flagellar biosynthesis protein, partial [Bacillales bacterium]|nr:TIGR02530 family flagellar biosynthesis protein [Bacillales bacterium]
MDQRIQRHVFPRTLPQGKIQGKEGQSNGLFGQVLQEEVQRSAGLNISKHAAQRMNERNISIEPGQWKSIQHKVLQARQKGITDSLVVTKNAALVVSAKNNTVVTAMDRKEASTHIFTN